MEQETIIHRTLQFVKTQLNNTEHGHDYFHALRVYRTALYIAGRENADTFTVALGALLHDIADAKFHGGDEETGPRIAGEFLKNAGVDDETIRHIKLIIKNISFRHTLDNSPEAFSSIELKVLQDADRLDAMGAIGIARAFHYGGYKNRLLYDPGIPPVSPVDAKQYLENPSPTINHFYEKLLKLKDLMHTRTGKMLAEERHLFMEEFLRRFYDEWNGKNPKEKQENP